MTAHPPAKREPASRGRSLEPAESPGFLLWRATMRWQRVMKSTLRPFGLTHVQFVLLASLWWLTEVADETPSQRRLADHAGTDPMMTSQVLRTLEARGLVNRSAHPTDSRTHQLAVTAAGSALAARAVIAVEEADQAFFVPAGGRRTITEFMRALAEL